MDAKKWEHNPQHRENVRYRDQSTAKRYEGRQQRQPGPNQLDRNQARGFDGTGGRRPGEPATRPGGPKSGDLARERPGGREPGGGRQPTAGGTGRPGGGGNALGGYQNGHAERTASTRGAASRESAK